MPAWDWNRDRLCGRETGVFGAVIGCKGVAGFNGCCSVVSIGVVVFKVATSLRPVRDIFRPARPDVGASAKKFTQCARNGAQSAIYGVLGELFRGNGVGGGVLGELCRATNTVPTETAVLSPLPPTGASARPGGHAPVPAGRPPCIPMAQCGPLKQGDEGPYDGVTAKGYAAIIAQRRA